MPTCTPDPSRRWLGRTLAASLLFAACAAHAHDTWLRVGAEQPGAGLLTLELGTGGRYPRSEGVVPGSRIVDAACLDEAGASHGLAPRRDLPATLELRARTGAARAVACWIELMPVDLQLTADLVRQYFEDVRAPQVVRDAWAAQQRAGTGWTEVYRKYVRIEAGVPGAQPADAVAALRKPRGFALELVPVGTEPVKANAMGTYQALSKGQPVAGLAVEFVSARNPVGIWRETDAQGRVQLALPFGGEWLLRSTAFDLPRTPDEPWRTRFATLTVMVR